MLGCVRVWQGGSRYQEATFIFQELITKFGPSVSLLNSKSHLQLCEMTVLSTNVNLTACMCESRLICSTRGYGHPWQMQKGFPFPTCTDALSS